MIELEFITILALIAVGLYALLFKTNLIKIVMGIVFIESGVNLFLIQLGYRADAIAPIFTFASSTNMVLPTPQALVLTNIVIGVAITALMLSLVIVYYRNYGSADMRARRLKG